MLTREKDVFRYRIIGRYPEKRLSEYNVVDLYYAARTNRWNSKFFIRLDTNVMRNYHETRRRLVLDRTIFGMISLLLHKIEIGLFSISYRCVRLCSDGDFS